MKLKTKSGTTLILEASVRIRFSDSNVSLKKFWRYLIPVAFIVARVLWAYFHGG